MSSSTVYDAVKSRLMDQLGASYPIRDFEEIETAQQQGTTPWLVIEDGSSESNLQSVGTPDQNWTLDEGSIIVHVMVPANQGLSTARTIGGQVRDAMQYQYLTANPGETLRILDTTPPDTGLMFDGLWSSMVVFLNYTYRYAVATAAE